MEEFDSPPNGSGETDVLPSPAPRRDRTIPSGIVVRETFSFGEIYDSTDRISWVIEGLLPDSGLMYVGARSGTGKTNLVIQIIANLIFDRDTMTLKRGENLEPQKIVILSLEMAKKELQARFHVMYPNIPEEEKKLLDESIDVYCGAEPFSLWKTEDMAALYWLIKSKGATGVVIDSASVSFADSLKDDMQVNKTISNLYAIRQKLNVWMICISHTRKLPAGIVGNMEDVTVDELFGHSGVAQSASSVLLMHWDKRDEEGKDGKNKIVWLMNAKARFAAEFPPFKMYLPKDPPILFRRRDPIPLPRLTPEKRAEANRVAARISFAEALEGIDFGSIGGIDDD